MRFNEHRFTSSGVKYRFYVSNDISGNNVSIKEIVGNSNSDNTFTFDTSYTIMYFVMEKK